MYKATDCAVAIVNLFPAVITSARSHPTGHLKPKALIYIYMYAVFSLMALLMDVSFSTSSFMISHILIFRIIIIQRNLKPILKSWLTRKATMNSNPRTLNFNLQTIKKQNLWFDGFYFWFYVRVLCPFYKKKQKNLRVLQRKLKNICISNLIYFNLN